MISFVVNNNMKVSFYDIKGEVKMSENELKSCPNCGGKMGGGN
jgi:ribosomal protein S27AE